MSVTAIFDAGKTRLKLSIVAGDGSILWVESAPSRNGKSPAGVLDVDRAGDFFVHAMGQAASRYAIDRIVPVGHGAAAAWLNESGLALPVSDYEAEIPSPYRDAYERVRPDFCETFSPSLPLGLNLGRQLAYAEATNAPRALAATTLVPWPQYWAWRLCGQRASEVSSLGCHTDLWAVKERGWSSLARSKSWDERFAPIANAQSSLGTAGGSFAREAGLGNGCEVLCGAHDSNAALFAVGSAGALRNKTSLVSTGTWTITMVPGASLDRLDPARDCVGNISVSGEPVPTCRFMGGIEYARLAGDVNIIPDVPAISDLIRRGTMALPAFSDAGGPFSGIEGRFIGPAAATAMESAALATLYYALMVSYELDLLGGRDAVVFEGIATRNPLILALVASLADVPVFTCAADSVAIGAARMATPFDTAASLALKPIAPLRIPGLDEYANRWRAAVAEHGHAGDRR